MIFVLFLWHTWIPVPFNSLSRFFNLNEILFVTSSYFRNAFPRWETRNWLPTANIYVSLSRTHSHIGWIFTTKGKNQKTDVKKNTKIKTNKRNINLQIFRLFSNLRSRVLICVAINYRKTWQYKIYYVFFFLFQTLTTAPVTFINMYIYFFSSSRREIIQFPLTYRAVIFNYFYRLCGGVERWRRRRRPK